MSRGRYPRRFKVEEPSEAVAARYLRKWSSKDLYHHPERFPKITSQDLFENDQPLGLEIGCGTGEFLCELAMRRPEINFIGVDIVLKPLYRGVHQAADLGLTNLLFIKADFKRLYPLFMTDALRVVYLHFPLPGKKRKHTIFKGSFLDEMFQVLSPGGRISVRTDQSPLFEKMLDLASEDNRFRFLPPEAWGMFGEADLGSPTQKVWEDRGISTQEFELEKR